MDGSRHKGGRRKDPIKKVLMGKFNNKSSKENPRMKWEETSWGYRTRKELFEGGPGPRKGCCAHGWIIKGFFPPLMLPLDTTLAELLKEDKPYAKVRSSLMRCF